MNQKEGLTAEEILKKSISKHPNGWDNLKQTKEVEKIIKVLFESSLTAMQSFATQETRPLLKEIERVKELIETRAMFQDNFDGQQEEIDELTKDFNAQTTKLIDELNRFVAENNSMLSELSSLQSENKRLKEGIEGVVKFLELSHNTNTIISVKNTLERLLPNPPKEETQ